MYIYILYIYISLYIYIYIHKPLYIHVPKRIDLFYFRFQAVGMVVVVLLYIFYSKTLLMCGYRYII